MPATPRSVLHLVHVYPPESHGGTELYVRSLAEAQARAGARVEVAAGADRPHGDTVRIDDREGVRVHRLPANRTTRSADMSCPETTAQILAIAAAGRFDLVHLHHWHNLATDVVRSLADAGFPVLVTLSDYHVTCPRFFRLPDLKTACPLETPVETCIHCVATAFGAPPDLVREAYGRRQAAIGAELRRAHARIALSRSQAEFFRGHPLFAGLEVLAIPYPSPTVEAEPCPPGRGDDGVLRVVSWGGLDPGKGFEVVVDAAQRVRHPERIALHHHGTILDPRYRDALLARAGASIPVFHGRFDREQVRSVFPTYDVAVFMSYYLETHGLAVDEALQLGLPVVVSDRGAPPERMGTRGLVIPAGDADALATAFDRMIAEPGVLAALRAGTAPKTYTLAAHLEDLDRLYTRVLYDA